ncbi:MAG: hypothetical protein ACFFAH_15745 [Promethearchaeota archaeon]
MWSVAITILFIAGLSFLNKGMRRKKQSEKLILFGFASLFFGISIYRLLFFMVEFTIPGTYRNNAFYGDYDYLTQEANIIYIPLIIGYFFFVFFFEIAIKHTKYILSSSGIIVIMIIIIFPFLLTHVYFLMFCWIYLIILMLIIILYLTKYSQLEFKAIASLLLFGLTLIFSGMGLKYPPVVKAIAIPLFIPPILVILGTLITISPVKFNPKTYKQTLLLWIFIGVIEIGVAILFILQIFLSEAPIYLIVGIVLIAANLVFIEYKIIKIIRSQAPGKLRTSEEEVHLDLSMFSRPQKITEEEVTVSKEKKICLVCKNKVKKLTYICPECYSFYCFKCSDVISDLDNACWVCETPFDESKPIKLPKKEKKGEKEAKIHK